MRYFRLPTSAFLLCCAVVAFAATPQQYPSRPVRFLVPNPPGGGTDLVARIVAQKVSERWSVQLIADNRPGAGGVIAVEVAAKSAPDGYTLLMAHFPLAITVNLVKRSEEHTSELQSQSNLVCRLLLEKKKK